MSVSPLPGRFAQSSNLALSCLHVPSGDIMILIRELSNSLRTRSGERTSNPRTNPEGASQSPRLDPQGDERSHGNSGFDSVESGARPADPDLRQAAPAQPEAEHPHLGAVRRKRAGGRRRHCAAEHRPDRRFGPRHDAELRLLLFVHGAPAEADGPDPHSHPRQVARASSAISSATRARNISTCSKAASSSTPNSTIR